MKLTSIRARLAAWYSLILAFSLCTFGGTGYLAMRHSIRVTLDAGLEQRIEGVRAIIAQDAPQGFAALQDEIFEYATGIGSQGRVRLADAGGKIIFASPGLGPSNSSEHMRGAKIPRPFTYERIGDRRFRVLRRKINAAGAVYDVEVASSTEDFDRALTRFRLLLVLAVPFLLVLAAVGGDWMGRRALAPVDELTNAARSIEAQDLARRLTVPQTGDELERLADTLNEMLARLEGAFHRMTKFTADASHELRTPVSVMRTSAELSLRKPRTAEQYREALCQILVESEKVSQLIEQLLILARADAGPAVLPLVPTDLTMTLSTACQEASPLAQAKQLTFCEFLPQQPLWIRGDASALGRLFLILLDNAVKYTPGGGRIEVRLSTEDGLAVANIRDTGIGIAPEDLPHVFDRFYRADPARSRESGGAGLGLAIGRWIVEAHHGEIRVESQPSKGSSFQIRLPLARE